MKKIIIYHMYDGSRKVGIADLGSYLSDGVNWKPNEWTHCIDYQKALWEAKSLQKSNGLEIGIYDPDRDEVITL